MTRHSYPSRQARFGLTNHALGQPGGQDHRRNHEVRAKASTTPDLRQSSRDASRRTIPPPSFRELRREGEGSGVGAVRFRGVPVRAFVNVRDNALSGEIVE
jgi:hypothetical protein